MIIEMIEIGTGYYVANRINRHGIIHITDEDIRECFKDKRVDYSDRSFKDAEFWK